MGKSFRRTKFVEPTSLYRGVFGKNRRIGLTKWTCFPERATSASASRTLTKTDSPLERSAERKFTANCSQAILDAETATNLFRGLLAIAQIWSQPRRPRLKFKSRVWDTTDNNRTLGHARTSFRRQTVTSCDRQSAWDDLSFNLLVSSVFFVLFSVFVVAEERSSPADVLAQA